LEFKRVAAGSEEVAADALSRWYVVYTQPHREFSALIHLKNQRIRSFLPLCRKTVRHARQFRTRNAPFFPRYLFVAMVIGQERWRSVNGTHGVSHLLMEGDRPKPVPKGVVEGLIAAADGDGLISMGPGVVVGQRVRILEGPFAGSVGELSALDENGRVRILLELMGSIVAVSASQVGVVPAA